MITKELKLAATVCGVILGRIIWKNFKKDVNDNYEKNVDKVITKEIGDAVVTLEEGLADMKANVDKIESRENAEIDSRLKEFKESIHYDEKIKAYQKEIDDGVKAYKAKIDSDKRVNAAKIALGKEIEQYKKENSYDRKVESFKKAIKEAENDYDAKLSRYKVFADREELETLKEKAKVKRDGIVNMNKIELETLEKEFNTFSDEAVERANAEINAVNALIHKEVDRLKA
jgi:tetratricopeptide (TPR) repeat protein